MKQRKLGSSGVLKATPFDAQISLARAMFKEFGGPLYDDNKFLHRLKKLYEEALENE